MQHFFTFHIRRYKQKKSFSSFFKVSFYNVKVSLFWYTLLSNLYISNLISNMWLFKVIWDIETFKNIQYESVDIWNLHNKYTGGTEWAGQYRNKMSILHFQVSFFLVSYHFVVCKFKLNHDWFALHTYSWLAIKISNP